jgi:flagellar motor component MotA
MTAYLVLAMPIVILVAVAALTYSTVEWIRAAVSVLSVLILVGGSASGLFGAEAKEEVSRWWKRFRED